MTSSPLNGKVTTARSSWPEPSWSSSWALALGHVEVDVGVADPQQVEELGHQPAPGGADHAQAHRADDLLAQRRDVGHHVGELVHDPAGPADDDLALLGEAAGGPVDQLHIELALQPGHVGRHVGLHRADGRGRGREAAGVGDAEECLQMFQLHNLLRERMLAAVMVSIRISDRLSIC
jgi:hypothetical protein